MQPRVAIALSAWIGSIACGDEVRIAHAPTAFAGFDRIVTVGDEVVLDASLSTDPDGDVLSFIWTIAAQPMNASSSLDTTLGPVVRFVPDRPGVFVAVLSASDEDFIARDAVGVTAVDSTTSTNTLELIVAPNVCLAQLGALGASACADSNDHVTIEGTASGSDRIDWRFVRLPTGISADDLNADIADPIGGVGSIRFEPPRPGAYWIAANAKSGRTTSPTIVAAVRIFDDDVTDRPTARIDVPSRVAQRAVVLFDGRASTVGTSTTVERRWTLVSDPSGGRDDLTDTQTGCPPDQCRRLMPSAAGTYLVSLEVITDGREGAAAVAAVEVE